MRTHTRPWILALALALLLVPLLRLATPGAAMAASGDCTTSGVAVTCTFDYTRAAQTWTAPAGVTEATFDLYGAEGQNVWIDTQTVGGKGGRVRTTLSLCPAPPTRCWLAARTQALTVAAGAGHLARLVVVHRMCAAAPLGLPTGCSWLAAVAVAVTCGRALRGGAGGYPNGGDGTQSGGGGGTQSGGGAEGGGGASPGSLGQGGTSGEDSESDRHRRRRRRRRLLWRRRQAPRAAAAAAAAMGRPAPPSRTACAAAMV